MNLYSVSVSMRINKSFVCSRTLVEASNYNEAASLTTNQFGHYDEFEVTGIELKATDVPVMQTACIAPEQ